MSTLPFSPSLFSSHLTTQLLGRFLLYRLTTPSTQLLAKREAIEGAPNGTLILAEQQTAGKGRVDGRTWLSPPAHNLYFTLLLRPSDVRDITKLNFALSLAVCRAVEASAPAGLQPRVKWPNDVWVGGRKVAGVLVDVDMMGSACTVSAGIGVNVNQDWTAVEDKELRDSATSLLTAQSTLAPGSSTPQPIVRERLLAALLQRAGGAAATAARHAVAAVHAVRLSAGQGGDGDAEEGRRMCSRGGKGWRLGTVRKGI